MEVHSPPREISKLAVIGAVARRSGPHLIEATIIPAVLFYCCLVAAGLGAAYVAALGWSYAALARRVLRRRPVPPILVLGIIGITVRTLVAVISDSSFIYFFQPILATVAMGCVFLISVFIGQPLIGRLAHEFWPITPEMAARPGVLRLFRDLTLLWAAVNLASAALTMALLLSLPMRPFLAVRQVAGLCLTAGAVFLTVTLSLRTARREGLAFLPVV
jgi:intracellular septation protein A